MYRTDDPLADFHRWDAEQQRELNKLPKCAYCDEPIQEDYCYEINDEPICNACVEAHHRKRTEDYMI